MWLLQSKQGSMKLVREIPWTAFSTVYYLDVLLIIRLYKFYHFILGIGAGLESMTINQMSWDGDVNPKVYLLFSSFNLFQKVCWWFFFMVIYYLDWIFKVILIMAAKEFSKSPRLPSTHGYYFRECCTSFRCDKAGAGSGSSKCHCSAKQYIATWFVLLIFLNCCL